MIVTYGPGEFMGEIGLLTGQRAYLTAVVSAPGRVLRIPVQQVHTIMDQELELSELILRAFLVRHSRLTRLGSGLTLVGSRFDVNTRRLLEVLSRNRLSSRWLDLEGDSEAEAFLRRLNVPVVNLPIVVVPGGELLRNPTNRALLDALGLATPPADDDAAPEVCDLLVVGGRPAGLAAAVYGASEGLTTTLAEDTALGGQAGTSSRIENYLRKEPNSWLHKEPSNSPNPSANAITPVGRIAPRCHSWSTATLSARTAAPQSQSLLD
jgi:thioredoxin reductase (NADPH)